MTTSISTDSPYFYSHRIISYHLMRFHKTSFLLILAAVASLSARAQSDGFDQAVAEWYQEERFLLADRNEDALLDRSELEPLQVEFGYFLTGDNYRLSDLNKDSKLSFNEIRQRAYSEMMYRYRQDQNALRQLSQEHPILAQVDLAYLKDHPGLVEQLFGNYLWLYQNEDLADRLMADKIWLARYPQALMAMHQNLRWMAAHPKNARALYGDRELSRQLPQLQGWRSAHLGFIPKYPRLEQAYDGGFLPKGVQKN